MLEGGGNRRRFREASNHNAGLMLTKGEKRIGTDKVSDFRAIPRKIQKLK